MPPSHHSHSSHSSHSHSSSSHSHSSHSSRSRSSSNSHSYSLNRSSRASGAAASVWLYRPEKNQPKGYKSSVRRFCGTKHNYSYYDKAWSHAGIAYQAGYYDENGSYYKDIAFVNRGDTLLCHCSFCGTETKVPKDAAEKLACPGCGAGMDVVSVEDELICEGNPGAEQVVKPKNLSAVIIVAILLSSMFFTFTGLFGAVFSGGYESTADDYVYSTPSNADIFGNKLYLNYVSDNGYEITTDESEADKILAWDYGAESYYDAESNCYLWYNTDVAPNLWQYWYEGISSDYGDYGWMEYEDPYWYVEASSGYWQELPNPPSYLWYIIE